MRTVKRRSAKNASRPGVRRVRVIRRQLAVRPRSTSRLKRVTGKLLKLRPRFRTVGQLKQAIRRELRLLNKRGQGARGKRRRLKRSRRWLNPLRPQPAAPPAVQEPGRIVVERYFEDAAYHARTYDYTAAELQESINLMQRLTPGGEYRTALWFIPHFIYAFYGGIHTIFRFADYLARRHGIRNSFAIVGVAEVTNQPQLIAEAFPLLADSSFYAVANEDYTLSHIPAHDMAFCTAWQTAYPLLKFNRVRQKLYFMQDYEPYFYPAGTIFGLAEATYRFGFKAVCNTMALKESYDEFGGRAIGFTPAFDRRIFYPGTAPIGEKERYRIVFYGRPFGIRNCFETGIEALRRVKQQMGDRVEIISAGGPWDVAQYGMEGIISNLERLPYEQTGEFYRSCDLGLSLMMTRHTSYLPIELMASGCPVVTNTSRWKTWLLKDNVNCLLTEPTAASVADRVIQGLTDHELRRRVVQGALETSRVHPEWDGEFDKVMKFIVHD
ncbi:MULTISPECIES: rhamnosyltransferase WsaF family glycosyltransferase [Paenibacillus]|uniref:rhamnosyltransferase WsaF family glycosyltransferase n=1 Tax=Paenibacillus TaxID=44249 RepID=UPI0022B93110|nr:glycosyltransferase [Paenibacillus caseinilyticus]MCZ8519166.1 glycosyltransferase [Paenibacillus caseinilyticus]